MGSQVEGKCADYIYWKKNIVSLANASMCMRTCSIAWFLQPFSEINNSMIVWLSNRTNVDIAVTF